MNNLSLFEYLSLGICSVIVLFIFFVWIKYARNKVSGITIEFYPPKEISFSEIEYLYKGYRSKISFFSLLETLKAGGFVEEKTYNTICKVKEYKGNSQMLTCFLEELSKLPQGTLYRADSAKFMRKVLRRYENLFFDKRLKRVILFLIGIIFVVGINYIIPVHRYGLVNVFSGVFIFVSVIYACILALVFLVFLGLKKLYRSRHFNSIFGWIFALVYLILGGMCSYNGINFIMPSEGNSFVGFIISILLILALTMISDIEKRTKYGESLYCRILGFKNFLSTVHKEQMEEMIKKDPNYINEVTPYFRLFEISDWVL